MVCMRALSYTERISHCLNPAAKRLLKLMEQKQTNLAVSADVFHAKDLLDLADQTGPYICLLKTHIDLLKDFHPDVVQALSQLAHKHQFLLFEDRKFADIGNTVKGQYSEGIYHIAAWAQFVNAHIIPGPGIIEGLKEIGLKLGNGLILIAEMSSRGNLLDKAYQAKTLAMALAQQDFVCGFITQHRLTTDPAFINFTPGIHLAAEGDGLGQQYTSPVTAILEHHSDVIIVGRGIYQAEKPSVAAEKYREIAWGAYRKRLA
jgi:orotidine 5'-phosphate decarboxylase subfamily 1